MTNVISLPISGMLKELLAEGLSYLYVEGCLEIKGELKVDNRDLADLLAERAEFFRERLRHAGSSRLMKNDRDSYFKDKNSTFRKWFGPVSPPNTYTELMIFSLKNVAELLEKDKVDASKSLRTIDVSREIKFGVDYKGAYAIIPAVVKQVEYYDCLLYTSPSPRDRG